MTGDEAIAEVRRLLANGAGARDASLYSQCLEMARALRRAGNSIDESVVRCIIVGCWRRDRAEPRAWDALAELAEQVERLRVAILAGDVGHSAARDASNLAAKALADIMPSGRHGVRWWYGGRSCVDASSIAIVGTSGGGRWWWRARGLRGMAPTEAAAQIAALGAEEEAKQ